MWEFDLTRGPATFTHLVALIDPRSSRKGGLIRHQQRRRFLGRKPPPIIQLRRRRIGMADGALDIL
jgi:hypothetical protein